MLPISKINLVVFKFSCIYNIQIKTSSKSYMQSFISYISLPPSLFFLLNVFQKVITNSTSKFSTMHNKIPKLLKNQRNSPMGKIHSLYYFMPLPSLLHVPHNNNHHNYHHRHHHHHHMRWINSIILHLQSPSTFQP